MSKKERTAKKEDVQKVLNSIDTYRKVLNVKRTQNYYTAAQLHPGDVKISAYKRLVDLKERMVTRYKKRIKTRAEAKRTRLRKRNKRIPEYVNRLLDLDSDKLTAPQARKLEQFARRHKRSPGRPPSAYILFSNVKRAELDASGFGTDLERKARPKAMMKAIGKAWRSLSDVERWTYNEEADILKNRFARTEKNQELKESKRPLNAFMLFSKDMRVKLKKHHFGTEYNKKDRPKEMMKAIGEAWRGLSADRKEKYKKMYRENTKEYQNTENTQGTVNKKPKTSKKQKKQPKKDSKQKEQPKTGSRQKKKTKTGSKQKKKTGSKQKKQTGSKQKKKSKEEQARRLRALDAMEERARPRKNILMADVFPVN